MLLALQHCKEFCEKYYFSQNLNLVSYYYCGYICDYYYLYSFLFS